MIIVYMWIFLKVSVLQFYVYYLALLISHIGVEIVGKLEKRYHLQAQWSARRIWRRSKS